MNKATSRKFPHDHSGISASTSCASSVMANYITILSRNRGWIAKGALDEKHHVQRCGR